MCGIAGDIERQGGNSVPIVGSMLETIKHRGPDGFGLYNKHSIQRVKNFDDLSFNERSEFAFGHSRLAIVGGEQGIQPFEGCHKGLVVLHNGEIYNYKSLRTDLSNHKFETSTDSETIVHMLEDHYNGDLSDALAATLRRLDGVFAIVATDGKNVAIARDTFGVKQLYFSETNERIVFSSERKALWRVGVNDWGNRLLPGHLAFFAPEGATIRKFREPPISNITDSNVSASIEGIMNEYIELLRKAVSKRVEDMGHIGVIFSGGIDSVLIAKIAKDLGAKMTCYGAGTEDSGDLKQAQYAATSMGLEIRTNLLTAEKVDNEIPTIIQTIEDRNLSQVEVAMPIYFSVQMAQEDGIRVMLTGQAADELFAGYPWYRDVLDKEGYASLTTHMIDDLLLLYKETLEREDKITMARSIELRVPYLDYELVKFVTGIDTRLKLPVGDKLGKHIHREAALRVGVPESLALRPKEAAQHGSGIRGLIQQIAISKGYNEEVVKMHHYSVSKSIPERLGSSQRYGHLYSNEAKWETPDNVQLFLDTLSLKNKLTSQNDQLLLESLLRN